MIRLFAELEECAEIEEHVEATVALVQRLGWEFEQRGMAGFGAGVTGLTDVTKGAWGDMEENWPARSILCTSKTSQ